MLNIYSVTRNSNLLVDVIQVKCCEFWACIQAQQQKMPQPICDLGERSDKTHAVYLPAQVKEYVISNLKVEIHTDFLIYLVSGMLSLK